ncbi:enoyl-CoA hydratase/isomerase family protein [Fodinisporobacter ferrooxydans]|uniref:Enoyl-CoA hydratase/isomerase family protein n=1 Tax=Fodinisporobacter ferrooxydans TaxID=2901836 RepID=A0ABY4CE36_9BACL|nr:enoyl-CoA hydratase/isomerase family protein [Alicyclobacillaceae bacterium MYW30-H2]
MRVDVRKFGSSGSLRFQTSGPVGIVTINRPYHKNALSREMWKTLGDWCNTVPLKTKLLILRGSGSSFTAGSDIKEFSRLTTDEANEAFETMERAIHAVEFLTIPTIAAINGPAYGAGFILSLACDLRIGTNQAKFGMPVGKLGITLQAPFVRRMVQTIGPSRTKELVFTARSYSAEEALQTGILNEIVSQSNLDNRVFQLSKTILQQSQASIASVKEGVKNVVNGCTESSREWVDKRDFLEGVQAFTQKRAAHF